VFSPVRRDPYPPAGYSAGRVLRELAALIRSRRSVLVFTNTRSGAEQTGIRLKSALPELADVIEVHHSSLDRNLRLDVEDRLKNGSLRAVVCSTSLEMGVDIGAIDLVVMISAPKGISRALQRIGRSGHSIKQVSHGILVATNVVDLVECAVTARLARERRLDPVRVTENAADVLAQHLVGCAMAEPGIAIAEAWALVRRAYPFRELPRAWFDRVLEYLEGGGRSLAQAYAETFGKIRLVDGRIFTVSPRIERESLVNMGTIVTVGHVDVVLKRRRLGTVEEYFIKHLKPGDVFVIAGRTVRLLDAGGQSARVEAAEGERPNVPSWGTAGLALTSGLAEEISLVRQTVDALLEQAGGTAPGAGMPPTALDYLVENWDLSAANAQAVIGQFVLQRRHSVVPHNGLMLIERYREPENTAHTHYFFHGLIGRPANDALSRIVARRVAALAGGNALVSTDDLAPVSGVIARTMARLFRTGAGRGRFAPGAQGKRAGALAISRRGADGFDGAAAVPGPASRGAAVAFQLGDTFPGFGGTRAGPPDAGRGVPPIDRSLAESAWRPRMDGEDRAGGLALAVGGDSEGEPV
jgi:ATP-dependent Lhr-like helicase